MSVFHLNFFFLGTEDLFFVFALDFMFRHKFVLHICLHEERNVTKYSKIRMRCSNFSPVWRDKSNYMSIFSPAYQASPVVRAGISSKRAGLACRAEPCNRKFENTYVL